MKKIENKKTILQTLVDLDHYRIIRTFGFSDINNKDA